MSRRTAAWTAWSLGAASLVLMVAGITLSYLHRSGTPASEGVSFWLGFLAIGASAAYPLVGAVVASRRPGNVVGWLLCTVGLAIALLMFTSSYGPYARAAHPGSLPGAEVAAFLSRINPGVALAGFVFLFFPEGRLPSRRWRPLVWLLGAGIALYVVAEALNPSGARSLGVELPGGIYEVLSRMYGAAFVASLVGSVASVALRLRRGRGEERQQIKWFAYAASVMAASGLGSLWLPSPASDVMWTATLLSFGAVPIAVGIAILRYRLYDIDLIINRTLVYGSLTACIVGIYVLVVGGFGALFQARGDFGVSLLATGVVAVLFQTLRGGLQRGVNRLMYGERDDPYAVTSRLGRRLEATLAPDAVLPTVVETIAQALKLPYAAILLKEGENFRAAAAYGSPGGEPETLPLVYQREEIGRLEFAPRAPGEGFSDADRRLLEGLARQAEVAVHAVRLTADLQRSRERLVATREEERRRLRRDLHDGLGAQLAGLNVQAGTLRRLIPRDPAAADELAVELRDELRAAIADIRRLVHDLRPPALDDLGLVEALRRLAALHGPEGGQPRVLVQAPDDLPYLPAAVEVAVYRIAQEALTNVVRHARAKTCVVRLAVKEDVKLEIADDGVGIPAERNAGVGLSSMRERAAELGGSCVVESTPEGGTRVLVRLPLEASGYRSQASGESEEPVAEATHLQARGSDMDPGTTQARATANEDRDLKAET